MNCRGLTLIELLIVLLILGLVASFTGPNLWRSYERYQERAVIQDFALGLHQRRAEAFRRGGALEFPAVVQADLVSRSTLFPELPVGWEIEHSTALRFLPTGVTNGATYVFATPNQNRWTLKLTPLDGAIEIALND